jgi:parallel beta-helix repeat protein
MAQDITITGQGHAVLDCGGSGGGEYGSGFTLYDATAEKISNDNRKVMNITVRNCIRGIHIQGGSTKAVVANVLIEGCTGPSGGGMFVYGGASPVLLNVTLRNNTAVASGGGGVHIMGAGTNPTFKGCTITGNQATDVGRVSGGGVGGGVLIEDGASPIFVKTAFEKNTAQGGGGTLA